MMKRSKSTTSTRNCSNKEKASVTNSCSRSKTATKSSNIEASRSAGKTVRGRSATTRSKKSK